MKSITKTISIENEKKLKRKHRDVIWMILGSIIPLAGLALAIYCIHELYFASIQGEYQPAFSGGITGGLSVLFAGIVQIILFVRSRRSKEEAAYVKTEHDYTNFFVKNREFNDMVDVVLLKSNLEADVNIKVTNESVTINIDDDKVPNNPINSLIDLRKDYYHLLINTFFLSDSVYKHLLAKKYNLNEDDSIDLYSEAFYQEMNKTLVSLEKMTEYHFSDKYDAIFFNSNMKEELYRRIENILPCAIATNYCQINGEPLQKYLEKQKKIETEKDNSIAVETIDISPFIIYYLIKKED